MLNFVLMRSAFSRGVLAGKVKSSKNWLAKGMSVKEGPDTRGSLMRMQKIVNNNKNKKTTNFDK